MQWRACTGIYQGRGSLGGDDIINEKKSHTALSTIFSLCYVAIDTPLPCALNASFNLIKKLRLDMTVSLRAVFPLSYKKL